MDKVCILNLNHTYENQDFYEDTNYKIIDLYELKNISRYCDEESLNILRNKLEKFHDYKIKFIDSGNYHYISYLFLEKIKQPFILVLFDHHTDMQPSFFDELMSCGCWVKKTLDDNKFIEKVILIGAKEDLIDSIEEKYKNRIICFSEKFVMEDYNWEEFSKKHIEKPIYISIDKDVINSKEAKTDWDQGSLTLDELKKIYISICKEHEIIGIDICGDTLQSNKILNNYNLINNKSNKKILDIIVEEESLCELNMV
ncbi:arginase family protein [Terrisporobacter sp.]